MSAVIPRRALVGGLTVLVASTALIQAPAAHAHHSPPKQWTLAFDGPTRTNTPVALFNQREADHLVYGERTFGINLKWSSPVKRDWKFVKCGAPSVPVGIRYDESLALYNVTNKKYVVYTHRDAGINLGWSAAPGCQWKVRGGPAGTPVGSSPGGGSGAMLFNTVEKDYLVNAWRPAGVNLRWYAYDFSSQVLDLAAKGTCAVAGLSDATQAACVTLKGLREFEKAMGYTIF